MSFVFLLRQMLSRFIQMWIPSNFLCKRTLRQKSWICILNCVRSGGFSVGLNFKPRPMILFWRPVKYREVKLWISEFRGRRSYKGRLAIENSHFSYAVLLSTFRGRYLCRRRFLTARLADCCQTIGHAAFVFCLRFGYVGGCFCLWTMICLYAVVYGLYLHRSVLRYLCVLSGRESFEVPFGCWDAELQP